MKTSDIEFHIRFSHVNLIILLLHTNPSKIQKPKTKTKTTKKDRKKKIERTSDWLKLDVQNPSAKFFKTQKTQAKNKIKTGQPPQKIRAQEKDKTIRKTKQRAKRSENFEDH